MSAVLEANATPLPRTDQRIRIAIFVISLKDAEKRRSVVTEYLSRLNVPWSFFDGFRYNPKIAPGPGGVEIFGGLSAGQVGCFLSHRALWKEIGDSKLDYAIVLEDDTVLIPSLDFYALFSLLGHLGLNYIRLTTHHINKAKTLIELGFLYGLVCRIIAPKYGLGTGAYALTPEAARHLHATAVSIDSPVDLWLEKFSNHGIAMYSLFPAPAIEMRTQSTIRAPEPTRDGFIVYVGRKVISIVSEVLNQRKLSRIDDALRKRADLLYPGMAVWPHSELRKYGRWLLRIVRIN
jgi:glycosyl transferase, family 25